MAVLCIRRFFSENRKAHIGGDALEIWRNERRVGLREFTVSRSFVERVRCSESVEWQHHQRML